MMMNNFDVIFDKIDNYLKDKKSSETSILFFLLFVIVGFLSYSYIYSITDVKLKQTSRLAKDMDKKLLDETSYIRSISKDIDEAFALFWKFGNASCCCSTKCFWRDINNSVFKPILNTTDQCVL